MSEIDGPDKAPETSMATRLTSEGDWEIIQPPDESRAPLMSEPAKSALAAYIEDGRRLAKSYQRLVEADREFLFAPKFRSTDELQQDLVDETHSYHRALYSNVGSFIKFFRLAAPRSLIVRDGRGMPYRKVSDWLAWVVDRFPRLVNLVEYVERSRRFLAEYIDHPQMENRSYSWITVGAHHPSWGWMTSVVYFSYPTGEVPVLAPDPEHLNPYEPGWTPMVGQEAFMLAPGNHAVQHAWQTLTTELFVEIGDAVLLMVLS
jgi:hypothetical protein